MSQTRGRAVTQIPVATATATRRATVTVPPPGIPAATTSKTVVQPPIVIHNPRAVGAGVTAPVRPGTAPVPVSYIPPQTPQRAVPAAATAPKAVGQSAPVVPSSLQKAVNQAGKCTDCDKRRQAAAARAASAGAAGSVKTSAPVRNQLPTAVSSLDHKHPAGPPPPPPPSSPPAPAPKAAASIARRPVSVTSIKAPTPVATATPVSSPVVRPASAAAPARVIQRTRRVPLQPGAKAPTKASAGGVAEPAPMADANGTAATPPPAGNAPVDANVVPATAPAPTPSVFGSILQRLRRTSAPAPAATGAANATAADAAAAAAASPVDVVINAIAADATATQPGTAAPAAPAAVVRKPRRAQFAANADLSLSIPWSPEFIDAVTFQATTYLGSNINQADLKVILMATRIEVLEFSPFDYVKLIFSLCTHVLGQYKTMVKELRNAITVELYRAITEMVYKWHNQPIPAELNALLNIYLIGFVQCGTVQADKLQSKDKWDSWIEDTARRIAARRAKQEEKARRRAATVSTTSA